MSGMEKFNLEAFPTSESAKKMLSYVTEGFYEKSYIGKWLYQVMGLEYDDALKLVKELPLQFFPETATWGLVYHEIKWQLQVREELSYEERRNLIYRKRDLRAPMTPYFMESYLKSITGFEVFVADSNDPGPFHYRTLHPNIFKVTFIGEGTLDVNAAKNVIKKIKQSHTTFLLNEQMERMLQILILHQIKLYMKRECYPRRNLPFLLYDGSVFYNGIYHYDGYCTKEEFYLYLTALSISTFFHMQIQQVCQLQLRGREAKWLVRSIITRLKSKRERKQLIRLQKYRFLIQAAIEIPHISYQINLTIGYHLTRYNGGFSYNGTRKYDSAIRKELL